MGSTTSTNNHPPFVSTEPRPAQGEPLPQPVPPPVIEPQPLPDLFSEWPTPDHAIHSDRIG